METSSNFLKIAKVAALEASPIALKYFNKKIKITNKGTTSKNDWVTLADINTEKKIVNYLVKHFPKHNIELEEANSIRNSSDYTWYIDPISNTYNFIRGLGHFGIIISLYYKNKPLVAVTFDPYYNELFWAQKGKGAWGNKAKARLRVSKINKLSQALGILRLEPNAPKEEIDRYLKIFSKISKQILENRFFGSNPLHLAYLAAGKFDFYINNRVDPRSHAAGYLIVKEAGGKMTDIKGKEWQIGENTVIASNNILHSQLLSFLK